MSFKIWFKQFRMQLKSNWAYRHLITRTYDGEEYADTIEFIHKDELPKDALNVRNYGKYWYYVEDGITPDPAPHGRDIMKASDVCTWADNNDVNRSLSEMWKWTNNLDMKKVIIVIGVAVFAAAMFFMLR